MLWNKNTLQREPRRGAAAIEFGLWLLPMAILISGIVDLGWYMSRYHLVQSATTDATRYGVRFATQEDAGDAGDKQESAAVFRADQMLDDFGIGYTTLDAAYEAGAYDQLRTTVEAPFVPLIGIVPMPTNIRAEFVMMSELQRP